jgi:hypothetical protein
MLSVAAHSSSPRWARTDAGSGVCTTENEQVRRSLVRCCSHFAAVGQMHCGVRLHIKTQPHALQS